MPRSARSRRTAAAAALAGGTLAAALLAPAAHAAQPAGAEGRTQHAFADAARATGVPESVLLAVGYLESRWQDHAGTSSTDGGYGPMNLTDVRIDTLASGKDDPGRRIASTAPSLHTLDAAAALTGTDAATLRTDPAANIRGGAALLASYARAANGGALPSTRAGWYGAVAKYSGAGTEAGAKSFADGVWSTLRSGAAATLAPGDTVTLAASPKAPADTAGLRRLGLAAPAADAADTPTPECPATLDCDFVPAAYKLNDPNDKGAYGNYDIADRPNNIKITHIVLHDTEGGFAGTLATFTNPLNQVSAHYVVRSGDGHVTQMVPVKDVAWQAGNWYINAHSVGIEQEGWAAQGATWFTESMYRSTAELVRYLARKYDIPMDRQHIIGHDNVPGTTTSGVGGMHWDPGPYWDWDHFMKVAGSPVQKDYTGPSSPLVTVNPKFADNLQTTTDCEKGGAALPTQGTSFVWLRTAPSDDAPLFGDPGLHKTGDGTTCAADWGDKASAGQQFAIAGRQGDWTAIWWDGSKVWFKDPAGNRSAHHSRGWIVTPKAGKASIPVFGRAYPEAAAYPADIPYQTVSAYGQYAITSGQSYAFGGNAPTDYYYAQTIDASIPGDRTNVTGTTKYVQIQFGHRIAFVLADDVDIRPAR